MQLGVIGLGTMGANLARNAARNGVTVAVYNRTLEKTDAFMKNYSAEGNFVSCADIQELLDVLEPPRTLLLMVKAGEPVDAIIQELLPHLSKGDILMDGGNSHYKDSTRRMEYLEKNDIAYIGMGISGGEEGALNGPSLMPGGHQKAYREVADLLGRMAADDGDGGRCVSFIGTGGAGHFVKTVHNGIEYGLMQIIAECYHLMRDVGDFSNEQIAAAFGAWSRSDDLNSFLLEITHQIFLHKDPNTGQDLIDLIADRAKQKGTGRWTTETALACGCAVPTITSAVDARILSGSLEQRKRAKSMPCSFDTQDALPPQEKFQSQLRNAFELATLCAYIQGFELMMTMSAQEQWHLSLGEVARIWKGGCIIRSAVLQKLQRAYSGDARKAKIATQDILDRFAGERQLDWRRSIGYAVSRGIPVPALSSALSYYDTLHHERLPQNLIQAQRDFFGAHGFERIDKDGVFHGDW